MNDESNTPPRRDPEEMAFYKKREKIIPREVHGLFALWRNVAMVALLGFFYGMPYVQWNGQQAILFDLPERKFHLFGLTLWPQDFFYLAMLLIISALALFFFTAIAGRLWCGYACPQTVWTEIFLWIERKIEGSRQQQLKLDKAPMDAEKLLRRGTKQLVWLLFSLWTGFTFVGWFTPITELWQSSLNLTLGPWETFWILFYGLATYGNAGWLREQVCIYMCPYARFQSAMFDKDTLLIAYDEQRGEPRGARKKSAKPEELDLGSCVDCKLCVQVCPTGIDIRDGLQYQCIGCAACIDICDEVMEKMGYPKGLVRYTTEHELSGGKTDLFRPRVLVYGSLLLLITLALFYSLATRVPLQVDILRDRNTLYVENNQGLIENVYTLRVLNMQERDEVYELSISGIEGAELVLDSKTLQVPAGDILDQPLRVKVDPVNLKSATSKLNFHIRSVKTEGLEVTQENRFLGPRG
ncbi:MAG: cytochrome c oxidase accessory protein CcoG [Gammaproteobacteria bacterium SHHR-1]|uniref:cytochrome c oxidase accessory protein CcoG n=1 Tax=Magnetovirga frankeli TaxID=947516 RepID=UPI00129371CE|nr:cytochrome c oxidase accessory protein CcoG [gamma proteobacterium SS-5]